MKTILVIDDDAEFRTLTRSLLQSQGYNAIEAGDAGTGIDLARTRRPDLVLCDVFMGNGGDGFAVLKGLLATPETAEIPVIIMTGHLDSVDARRAMDLGADDFLPKPFPRATLLDAISARLERRKATRAHDDALRSRLLAIEEATPDLVTMAEYPSGQVVYLNRAARARAGLGAEEDLGRFHLADFYPPAAAEELKTRGIPAAVECGHWTAESTFRARNGSEIPILQLVLAHRSAEGAVTHVSTIGRDVSEQKRTQERLATFMRIVEQSPASIVITDTNGGIEYVNPMFTEVTGYTLEEVLGKNPRVLKTEKTPPEIHKAMWTTLGAGRTWRGEFCNRKKNGDLYWEFAVISPFKDAAGTVTHYLAVKEEITARKRLEDERKLMEIQLRQAQKLESIGQLAAGIAHEINTPTQFVGDNTRFLQEAFGDLSRLLQRYGQLTEIVRAGSPPQESLAALDREVAKADLAYLLTEIPKAIQQSLEGLERVARIVRAMKDFSHPGSEEKTLVNLNKAIESTVTVSRNEWKYVAEMVTQFDPELSLVPCFPGEFNQVILNLVINAAHAIADVVKDGARGKGTITVSTQHLGDWVEVRVADTGTGIPDPVRDRVFDPFFTTKPVGKGTGQGLAIARSVVVDKHGGTLAFETEVGRGTTFIVRLPVKTQPPVL